MSPTGPSDQRGSGGGLFSGKGLLGKAMKQGRFSTQKLWVSKLLISAEKYGAGNIVGQAAGALGVGGGHGGGSYGAGQAGGGYGGM